MSESPRPSLLQKLAQGDKTALGEFYDLYSGLVNGMALRILRDVSEAEDVVQEALLRVHQALAGGAELASPRA